jgi:hypothetical protein
MPVLRSSASDFTTFVGAGAVTNGAANGNMPKVIKTTVSLRPGLVAKASVVTVASKVSVTAAPVTTVIATSTLKVSTTKRG